MTAVDNASAARAIERTDWAPANGLTAEGIMAYCASRLNSLDSLIKSRFEEQKKRNGALKEAGDLVARLSNWSVVTAGKDLHAVGEQAHRDNAAGLAWMYNNTTSPEVRQKISEAYRIVTGKDLIVEPDGKVAAFQLSNKTVVLDIEKIGPLDSAQWQGFIGGIKSVQDGLTKDSELSMIQLQSVVSQRQLAVQMTTQLLQTMHESCKQVVSNYR